MVVTGACVGNKVPMVVAVVIAVVEVEVELGDVRAEVEGETTPAPTRTLA
jgi:hypothetical protein